MTRHSLAVITLQGTSAGLFITAASSWKGLGNSTQMVEGRETDCGDGGKERHAIRHGGTCNPGTRKNSQEDPKFEVCWTISKFRVSLNQPTETLTE